MSDLLSAETEKSVDDNILDDMKGKILSPFHKSGAFLENHLDKPEKSSHQLSTPPTPLNIEYKVSLNGLPTGLKAEAKLRKHEDRYLFELRAKNWVLDYFEKSAFIWNESEPCLLQTESYQFTFEGFGKTEAFEVNIDIDTLTAHSNTLKGPVSYSVSNDVSDALSYLFKLQCDLRNDLLNPTYRIAYDNGVDDYIFKFSHEEKIKTSLGIMNTLVLKRVYQSDENETTYWISPELNYLMVKMKHKQGKLVTAHLKIKSIDFSKQQLNSEEESNSIEDEIVNEDNLSEQF